MSSKLADIHLKYKTDKGTDHSYIDTYDELFAPFQNKPVKLLEVGVLYGESLKLFDEYFIHKDSVIIGLDDFSQAGGADEVKNRLATYHHIHVVKANSKQLNVENVFGVNMPTTPPFDIIIDDGDHTVAGQVQTFGQLFPLLKTTGIYIIEDISGYHCASQIETAIKNMMPHSNIDIQAKYFYKNGRHDDVLMIIQYKA